MIEYFQKYHEKLLQALLEHLELVLTAIVLSLILAAVLTMLCMYSSMACKIFVNLFSMIYAIPSLAMFAMLMPLTGLGKRTAIIVLVLYNQYLLLRNFTAGLLEVDPSITDAATGMGMTTAQVVLKIRLPLARRALFAGVRLALVSTIGIATIAAFINAGGLGAILYDGLRTMNMAKIVWGSILSAGLAIGVNGLLSLIEKNLGKAA